MKKKKIKKKKTKKKKNSKKDFEKIKISELTGPSELIGRIRMIIRIERKIEVVFLIISLFLRIFLKFYIPWPVIGLIAVLFGLTFIFDFLFEKAKKSREKTEEICFIYWVSNISIVSFIVHCLGGIFWVGLAILLLPVVHSNILLSRRRGFILGIYAAGLYSIIGIWEFMGYYPSCGFFPLVIKPSKDQTYLFSTLIVGSLAIIPYVSYVTGKSSELLRKRTKELLITYNELEKIKSELEKRVKNRTKELENLNRTLEEKVKKRTEELQERIEELEKFHKITVGRELKMIELKRKVKELKKEPEKKPKNNGK